MHIKRIQIEEGFLDGLDLALPPGLITIIGARGTGKTSLVELVRFCLGVSGHTVETSATSRDHALSVLESGQITVTIQDGPRLITATRTKNDDHPRNSGEYATPIVFSQTEIENIGLQPAGRLRIIDGFVKGRDATAREEAAAAAQIRSFTAEAAALLREIDELIAQRAGLPALENKLAELIPQEQQLSSMSKTMKEKTDALDKLSVQISAKDVSANSIRRFLESAGSIRGRLIDALRFHDTLDPPPAGGEDPIKIQRGKLATIAKNLHGLYSEADRVFVDTSTVLQATELSKLPLEDRARELRREIEQLKEGAGAIMRASQEVKVSKAKIDALLPILKARTDRLAETVRERDRALSTLETTRYIRSEERAEVIGRLNKELGPRIRLVLEQAAQYDGFAAAIAEALRGSGLRYNELAIVLATNISPRELMECIEKNDVELICNLAKTSKDRAIRIISSLKEADLGALATTLVDDDVAFQLLDGQDYKDIGDLSTGQRCTVILPIILQHTERLLIVDQPEDHIDNAFIADTLIAAVKKRSRAGQIIFTTHNANIPVLGEADCVVELGSDGRRGFIKSAAPLGDQISIDAITQVMEGGVSAFETRASFYKLGIS